MALELAKLAERHARLDLSFSHATAGVQTSHVE
jgi:hypothetical protein